MKIKVKYIPHKDAVLVSWRPASTWYERIGKGNWYLKEDDFPEYDDDSNNEWNAEDFRHETDPEDE